MKKRPSPCMSESEVRVLVANLTARFPDLSPAELESAVRGDYHPLTQSEITIDPQSEWLRTDLPSTPL